MADFAGGEGGRAERTAGPALVVFMGLILSWGCWCWDGGALCPAAVLRIKSASSEPAFDRKRVRMMRVWINMVKLLLRAAKLGHPQSEPLALWGKEGQRSECAPTWWAKTRAQPNTLRCSAVRVLVERGGPNKNYICFVWGFALMLDIQKA